MPNGRNDEDEDIDLEEWSFAAGAALNAGDHAVALIEYAWEREREESDDETETERESLLSLGLSFELTEHIEMGGAYLIGLSDDTPDDGAILKIKAEW